MCQNDEILEIIHLLQANNVKWCEWCLIWATCTSYKWKHYKRTGRRDSIGRGHKTLAE